MRIFSLIVFNALILYAIGYFLPYDTNTGTGVIMSESLKLYFIGGVVLGVLNFIVKPFLKLLGLPFIFITFGLFILVINGVILYLFQGVLRFLNISGVQFEIKGWVNFIIAVAIFTIFNTIYNTFLKK